MKLSSFLVLAAVVSSTVSIFAAIPNDNRIAPGVTIAGIDVGGLKLKDAATRVNVQFGSDRQIKLGNDPKRKPTSLKKLGLNYNVREAVYRAYLVGRMPGLRDSVRRVFGSETRAIDLKLLSPADNLALDRAIDRRSGAKPNPHHVIRLEDGWGQPAKSVAIDRHGVLAAIDRAVRVDAHHVELPSSGVTRLAGRFTAQVTLYHNFRGKTAGSLKNLKLGTGYLDATYVPLGETFSFNRAVGPRIASRGFGKGVAIENGKITDQSIGGGACGASSVLYRAALKVGATVVERHGHSFRPSSNPGCDATVTSSKDLKLRFPQPVIIVAQVDGTLLRLSILSSGPLPKCLVASHLKPGTKLTYIVSRKFPDQRAESITTTYRR